MKLIKPKVEIKDVETKLDNAKTKGLKLDEFLNSLGKTDDIKEKILKEVVDKLFSKDDLLMIARLDDNLAYYIAKHLIIKIFYFEYYTQIKVKYKIVKYEKFPFYKREDIGIFFPDMDKVIIESYPKFINQLLMLTISFQGQGRNELIKLYDAINERIRSDDLKSQFLNKMGLSQ
jgi:hypothetical protein